MSQHRYAAETKCSTVLDPLEDCTAWFRGLRSLDFTCDVLRTRHGFSNPDKTRKCVRAIAAHADSAVDLLDQAFSGPTRVSYLPIYYAMLDLAKVAVLCRGRLGDLHRQRSHGLTWTGIRRSSHDLLTDHITLQEQGAFGLFYDTLVGQMWPKSAQKNKSGSWTSTYRRQVNLRDIYPYIRSVGFEYSGAYDRMLSLERVQVEIREQSPGKWRAEVRFPRAIAGQPPIEKKRFKILSGLSQEGDCYATRAVSAPSSEDARAALSNDFRWFLLYPFVFNGAQFTLTPDSTSNLLMPEEVPILLAFFHLGSVARYDPERLERLLDSRACAMLETLRRHATYQYLVAIWSFVMQSQVVVCHG